MANNKLQCTMCLKTFTNVTNLRRHTKNKHSDLSLVPMKYKREENYIFTCATCNKNFNHKRHFNYHLKVHENENSESNSRYSLESIIYVKCYA